MSYSENKRPWWQTCIQILLLPIVLPISLVAMVFVLLMVLVMLPVTTISNYFVRKAHWARLRKRGLVGEWADVVKELDSGGCTLILETFKKPPDSAVLIHHPRTSLDPERRIPTWHDIERDSLNAWKELDPAQRRTKVEEMYETQRSLKQKLFPIMESPDTSLQVVQFKKHQLAELSQSVKEEHTLVLWLDYEFENMWDVLQRLLKKHASTG